MKLGILALSLMLFTAGQTAPAVQDDVKKELDKIQGNWAVTTFNGQTLPSDAQAFLVFKGDKYEQWNNGAVDERGSIKLDPKTKPLSIDLIITEGNDAGKTQPGVYELTDADTLSVGLATPGSTTRPTAVSQAELQVVLKKTK
ncbi:MAG TPA: TIGR03067 domain-containing protein [Vicinamibacterales bacterium]|nr:TIGR03067 domain-containing protein [Vicinamibacterales bacterium]